MKKLDEIPKNNIFEVPDGYFERLPMRIQERVSQPASRPEVAWLPVFRFALPVLLLAGLGIFWFQDNRPVSVEEELMRIQADQLTFFLEDESLSTEELAESMTWSEADLQSLEERVYTTFAGSEADWSEALHEFEVP